MKRSRVKLAVEHAFNTAFDDLEYGSTLREYYQLNHVNKVRALNELEATFGRMFLEAGITVEEDQMEHFITINGTQTEIIVADLESDPECHILTKGASHFLCGAEADKSAASPPGCGKPVCVKCATEASALGFGIR